MQRVAGCFVLLLTVFVWGGAEGRAQDRSASAPASDGDFCAVEGPRRSFDRRGLALVYCAPGSGVALPLHGAHATARPLFYGAVPAAWVGAAVLEDRGAAAAAYRLTLTQGLTYGLVVGAKHAVGRARPYVDLPLRPRTERHRPPAPGDAHLSFPSGHASLSAALATSWSLSYPRGYVIGPAALWALGVAGSRVYLGVHYPSDVLAGLAVGAGVALLVHQLRATVTPPALRAGGAAHGQGLPVVLRLQF